MKFSIPFMTSVIGLAVAGCAGSASSDAEAKTASSSAPQAISASDKKTGAEAHPQLLQEFGGSYSGPQVPYVVQVGQNIAVQSGLSNARSDFTVTLLNSPVNNAFAIPGGYVYVTRQLMALMNDEAELAGVLGHEVGHVAARHSQKRKKAATQNALLGLLGQVASSVLLGDTALGNLGQKVFGTGSQLLTLRYSRSQETEADDLGIRYLAKAGYDTQALSTMLASLAAQTAIDARLSGGDARSVPAWASTHPDPAARVSRAAGVAKQQSVAGGKRNREIFLNNVDGLLYGDDPRQGVVEGRTFLHPDLRLKFSVPSGYGMSNGTRAVTISGSGGQGEFTTAAYSGNLNAYVDAVFRAIAGQGKTIDYGTVQRTSVNGIPAAYAVARVASNNSQVDVTVFAYELSNSSAFHFTTVTPAGQAATFEPMYQSLARLTAAQAGAIKPRRIDVVTVKPGDTISSIAARMAYSDYQKERFLVLNRLSDNVALRAGQQVKIVTY